MNSRIEWLNKWMWPILVLLVVGVILWQLGIFDRVDTPLEIQTTTTVIKDTTTLDLVKLESDCRRHGAEYVLKDEEFKYLCVDIGRNGTGYEICRCKVVSRDTCKLNDEHDCICEPGRAREYGSCCGGEGSYTYERIEEGEYIKTYCELRAIRSRGKAWVGY